ncbi:response regulator [Leptothoe kymatousa]|uniref:Response regulator n=1 Tax=Leptothoe kymatousa TAU-MAC 1615 TaxID=2364775 RepID=A0ABS5Y5J2_9CYAN|nr:response regulator [Leptothoe kymatousa]MBT9312629.1 response regulator [Leptothoe kymatousa TAU-MAC 1615]
MLTQAKSLAQYLLTLAHNHQTGELIVESGTGECWKLYFYSGRLIYATGGRHPVRRWYRSLKRHNDQFSSRWFTYMHTPGDYWEVDFIHQAVQRKFISLNQAKAAFRSIVEEVVLSLTDYPAEHLRWHDNRVVGQQALFVSVQQSLVRSRRIYSRWKAVAGDHLPTVAPHELPYLSPIIINARGLQVHLSAASYKRVSRWMQGNVTLWDIAAQTQRPMADVVKMLVPLIYEGWVDLLPIDDIPAPHTTRPLSQAMKPKTKGLVACIDDSPLVSKVMAELLQPMGYEVLPITRPVEQISILTQHRPDLIILDLIMPNISGYELCKFLRNTKEFYKTPIIILTGRDGMIDRVRAKMVGADDFLAKPPAPEKIAQLLNKHIATKDT